MDVNRPIEATYKGKRVAISDKRLLTHIRHIVHLIGVKIVFNRMIYSVDEFCIALEVLKQYIDEFCKHPKRFYDDSMNARGSILNDRKGPNKSRKLLSGVL